VVLHFEIDRLFAKSLALAPGFFINGEIYLILNRSQKMPSVIGRLASLQTNQLHIFHNVMYCLLCVVFCSIAKLHSRRLLSGSICGVWTKRLLQSSH